MTRRVLLTAAWVVASNVLSTTAALAQNRGLYPLGMSATNSGATPPPGFTYANQLIFYSRDHAKDDNGDTLPIVGANAVLMDMNTVTWAADGGILGGRYSASATLPVAGNSLTSDLQGEINGGTGFADSFYIPFTLGWEEKRSAIKALYGFLAPTGRFTSGAGDNVGSGYWTHTFASGQTFYLTSNRRFVASAFQMYETHTTQEGTGIQPGDTLDIDYSILAAIPATSAVQLQVGLVGYEARQTTAKTGPGVTAVQSAERYAVNAVGFAMMAAFPKKRASLGLKYFKEFANRSSYEGYSLQILGVVGF